MKTVTVLLKDGQEVTFPRAAVQEKDAGRLAIYDENYLIVAEFDAAEVQKWWYSEAASSPTEEP